MADGQRIRKQIYWAKNAHRVEVTDADFRADDRLAVIAAPPSAVSPARRNQPNKQPPRFEPRVVVGPAIDESTSHHKDLARLKRVFDQV
jgi:hypothetical protein